MTATGSFTVIPDHTITGWIMAQRPPRTGTLDPFKPHNFFVEQERAESGQIVRSAVILLTNKECPWRCLMCDLWMNTLTDTVPPGAIPKQIHYALAQLGAAAEQIKLYNSGSFYRPHGRHREARRSRITSAVGGRKSAETSGLALRFPGSSDGA